jgi:S1-C subfamily serine protease
MEARAVNSAQEFHNAQGRLPIGQTLEVEYLRKGKLRDTRLVVQAIPVVDGADLDYRLKGASFADLAARHSQTNLAGVLLDGLEPDSRLARQGLQPGDVITGANRQQVRNLADLRSVVGTIRGPMLLQVWRDGRSYIVRVD